MPETELFAIASLAVPQTSAINLKFWNCVENARECNYIPELRDQNGQSQFKVFGYTTVTGCKIDFLLHCDCSMMEAQSIATVLSNCYNTPGETIHSPSSSAILATAEILAINPISLQRRFSGCGKSEKLSGQRRSNHCLFSTASGVKQSPGIRANSRGLYQ